jgi:hypothetical protein
MIPIGDFVPEYSAAASALQPGEISEVVKTSFGYHVIRLNKRVGDEIDTNHILISVDQESYDNQVAIDALNAIRDSVLTNPDITFAEMARKHSEDPQTAPQGGRLMDPQTGNRLIPLSRLDPAMYRIVLLLEEEGQISEPSSLIPAVAIMRRLPTASFVLTGVFLNTGPILNRITNRLKISPSNRNSTVSCVTGLITCARKYISNTRSRCQSNLHSKHNNFFHENNSR